MIFDDIRRLIAENRIKEALNKLMSAIDDNIYVNELILFSRRLNSLQKSLRQNLISYDEANVNESQIADSLLNFLDLIEEQAKDYPKDWTGGNQQKLTSLERKVDTLSNEFRLQYFDNPQKAITKLIDQLFLLIREAQRTFNDQIFIKVRRIGNELLQFCKENETVYSHHFESIFKLFELGIHNEFPYLFSKAQIDKNYLIKIPAYSKLILALRLMEDEDFAEAKRFTSHLSGNPIANYVEGVCNRGINEPEISKNNLTASLELLNNFKNDNYSFLDLSTNINFLKAEIFRTLGKLSRKENKVKISEEYFEQATNCALSALKEIEPFTVSSNQPNKDKLFVAPIYDHYKIIADVHFSHGYYWYSNSKLEKAEQYFNYSIEALQNSGEDWDSPYTRMGVVQFCMGKSELALDYFSKGKIMCENTTHKNNQASLSLALCILGLSLLDEDVNNDFDWEKQLIKAIKTEKYSNRPLQCHRDDARLLQAHCQTDRTEGAVKKFINILQVELQGTN